MINITEKPGYITIVGHAGPPPDLICEGVTALFQTLVASLEDLTDDTISSVVEKGFSLLTYGYPSERARLLIDSFFVGVSTMAANFPDKVQVSRQE